jgi:hypothetical protein
MVLQLGEPFQGAPKRLEFAESQAKGQGQAETSELLRTVREE